MNAEAETLNPIERAVVAGTLLALVEEDAPAGLVEFVIQVARAAA